MLDGLTTEQWHTASLCTKWTVEQVAAHLTAAANTTKRAWLASITLAGFDANVHNARRLPRYLGDTPAETLDRFRNCVNLAVAPTKDFAAWLGEVIVHGQDIAQPLGVKLVPDRAGVREVAIFFAAKNFAVKSHILVQGLTLDATDDPFTSGTGPTVRGNLLDLVMAMAGRPHYLKNLDGSGVAELHRRLT